MKTIVLISLFSFLSIGVFAQCDLSLKFNPPIDFNSGILEPDSAYLSFKDIQAKPDLKNLFIQPKQKKVDLCKRCYYRRMPIAKPQGFSWNMPVAIPGSTINYAIQEKRFECETK